MKTAHDRWEKRTLHPATMQPRGKKERDGEGAAKKKKKKKGAGNNDRIDGESPLVGPRV